MPFFYAQSSDGTYLGEIGGNSGFSKLPYGPDTVAIKIESHLAAGDAVFIYETFEVKLAFDRNSVDAIHLVDKVWTEDCDCGHGKLAYISAARYAKERCF